METRILKTWKEFDFENEPIYTEVTFQVHDFPAPSTLYYHGDVTDLFCEMKFRNLRLDYEVAETTGLSVSEFDVIEIKLKGGYPW